MNYRLSSFRPSGRINWIQILIYPRYKFSYCPKAYWPINLRVDPTSVGVVIRFQKKTVIPSSAWSMPFLKRPNWLHLKN